MARAATTDTVTLRRTFVPVAVLQIEGEGQQAPIVVEGEGAVLGRAPVHGVTLPDPAVSRAHAKLELREGEFWIRDLGSSNGTIVNGMLVAECQLKPGDRILLGDTTLVYDKQQRLAGYRVG